MENVYIMNHPLIQHKISMLRNKNTGTNEFRKLVEEIGILMGYEALRDLPVENVEVETPIETCMTPMIAGKKLAVIPVLRAGLGMVNSILTLVPSAKVGHVGLYRDPVTHEPHEYYCKLPEAIDERISVIVDPMLATGHTMVAATKYLFDRGAKDVTCVCLLAAPEGLKVAPQKQPLTLSKNRAEKTLNSCASSQPLKDSDVSTKRIRMFRFTVDILIVN